MPIENNIKDREHDKFRGTSKATTKVAVEVEQSTGNSIPVTIVDGELGQPWHRASSGSTIPDTEVILINEVLTNDLNLKSFNISCSIEGVAYLKKDEIIIATARTGAGKPDINYPFYSAYPFVSGNNIKLSFKARLASKITDLEGYLQGSEIT